MRVLASAAVVSLRPPICCLVAYSISSISASACCCGTASLLRAGASEECRAYGGLARPGRPGRLGHGALEVSATLASRSSDCRASGTGKSAVETRRQHPSRGHYGRLNIVMVLHCVCELITSH